MRDAIAGDIEGDPNPLDPTNKYFRKCLNGHVAYSISFSECPSCKVVREQQTKENWVHAADCPCKICCPPFQSKIGHTYYQGEWPDYFWHQECTCDACRSHTEIYARLQSSGGSEHG